MFYVGVCYANGHGVKKNWNEAIIWWREAAALGQEKEIDFLKDLK